MGGGLGVWLAVPFLVRINALFTSCSPSVNCGSSVALQLKTWRRSLLLHPELPSSLRTWH